MIDRTWGVWADRNCLLVRTPGFALLFEREGSAALVSLSRIEADEDTVWFDTRALALVDGSAGRTVLKARDPEVGSELVFDNDTDQLLALDRVELTIGTTVSNGSGSAGASADNSELVLGLKGRPVERLMGDRLLLTVPTGRTAELICLERLVPGLPQPGVAADEGNIAYCLQSWSLGTGLYRSPDGTFFGFTIGTNRFSFGFSFGSIADQDALHCRVARVRATDNEVVFHPVLRFFARGERLAAAAADDFAAAAEPDLTVSATDCKPCLVDSAEEDELAPENWQLAGFESEVIELVSRSGGRYRLVRPLPDNPALLEWFRYQDYEQVGRYHR